MYMRMHMRMHMGRRAQVEPEPVHTHTTCTCAHSYEPGDGVELRLRMSLKPGRGRGLVACVECRGGGRSRGRRTSRGAEGSVVQPATPTSEDGMRAGRRVCAAPCVMPRGELARDVRGWWFDIRWQCAPSAATVWASEANSDSEKVLESVEAALCLEVEDLPRLQLPRGRGRWGDKPPSKLLP